MPSERVWRISNKLFDVLSLFFLCQYMFKGIYNKITGIDEGS
jgi:hypothetical protein